MKKSLIIVISLVAVFFFASTNQVMAQWSVEVVWNDNACSCANITSKKLNWEIRKTSDNSLFSSGEVDVTTASNPYTLTGLEIVEADQLFKVCIRVSYFEATIVKLCCSGTKCIDTDSAALIATGEPQVPIVLQ